MLQFIQLSLTNCIFKNGKIKKYNKHIGFSDHTKPADTNLIASKLAISLGASCIERHFTILDENMTKDGPVSINPNQLKELCELMSKQLKEYPSWRSSLVIQKNLVKSC